MSNFIASLTFIISDKQNILLLSLQALNKTHRLDVEIEVIQILRGRQLNRSKNKTLKHIVIIYTNHPINNIISVLLGDQHEKHPRRIYHTSSPLG